MRGYPIRQDTKAASGDPKLPAFLSPPKNVPVYHGFEVSPSQKPMDGFTEQLLLKKHPSRKRKVKVLSSLQMVHALE
jgi:hypothetical protein